jgi:hypothetical protein
VIDKNFVYFLSFILLVVVYFLYEESIENQRLYKICQDQEEVIQLQTDAIARQNLYINLLVNKTVNRSSYIPRQ